MSESIVSINEESLRLDIKELVKKTVRMAEFIELRDGVAPDERLFAVTKHFLACEMERGCKASGVKRIRVHDIRRSHVSLLIEMGSPRWLSPSAWATRRWTSPTATRTCSPRSRTRWP